MQKRLENMAESFSQKDMQKLAHGFENIEKDADITPAQQQRIMSSVMRKAGIQMNENRTRDNIKVSRGFKGFGAVAAAAAVALVVGVSAVSLTGRLKDENSSVRQAADTAPAAASSAEDSSNGLAKAEDAKVRFMSMDGRKLTLGTNTYEGEEYADRESVKIFESGDKDDKTVVMTLNFLNGDKHDICVRDITDMHYGFLEFDSITIDPMSVSTVVIGENVYSQDYETSEPPAVYDEESMGQLDESGAFTFSTYTMTKHFKLSKYLSYVTEKDARLGFTAEALDSEGREMIKKNADNIEVYIRAVDKNGNTKYVEPYTDISFSDEESYTFVTEEVTLGDYDVFDSPDDTAYYEAVWFVGGVELSQRRNTEENWLDDEKDKDSIIGKVGFSLTPNGKKARKFVDEKSGREFCLTGIGCYQKEYTREDSGVFADENSDKVIITLEYNDGRTRDMTVKDISVKYYSDKTNASGEMSFGYFDFKKTVIDVDSVDAVTVNGVRYTPEN